MTSVSREVRDYVDVTKDMTEEEALGLRFTIFCAYTPDLVPSIPTNVRDQLPQTFSAHHLLFVFIIIQKPECVCARAGALLGALRLSRENTNQVFRAPARASIRVLVKLDPRRSRQKRLDGGRPAG